MVSSWSITTFRCAADFGRYRGIADSGQRNALKIYDGVRDFASGFFPRHANVARDLQVQPELRIEAEPASEP